MTNLIPDPDFRANRPCHDGRSDGPASCSGERDSASPPLAADAAKVPDWIEPPAADQRDSTLLEAP